MRKVDQILDESRGRFRSGLVVFEPKYYPIGPHAIPDFAKRNHYGDLWVEANEMLRLMKELRRQGPHLLHEKRPVSRTPSSRHTTPQTVSILSRIPISSGTLSRQHKGWRYGAAPTHSMQPPERRWSIDAEVAEQYRRDVVRVVAWGEYPN